MLAPIRTLACSLTHGLPCRLRLGEFFFVNTAYQSRSVELPIALPHLAIILDKNQSFLDVVPLDGPPADQFDNLNWHDPNPKLGTVLDNHSFDDTFRDLTVHGLHSNTQTKHGTPSLYVPDFENGFTNFGLDLQKYKASNSITHEPPYLSDAYGLDQGYPIVAAMPPATLAIYNTMQYPPYNTNLCRQGGSIGATGNDIAPRFPCSFLGCTKSFKRSANRDRHSRKHQPEATSYHCVVMGCKYSEGKGFYRHDKLLSHERNVHQMHKE